MPSKFLVILTPYEEQALLQLAAKYDVSPLYAIRLCLVKNLYENGLLHKKIYEALLCKLLERPAPPPEEIKILRRLEIEEHCNDLPEDLAKSLLKTQSKFHTARRLLLELTEQEREFWIKEAERFSFLESAKLFLEDCSKLNSLLSLKSETPTPKNRDVSSGSREGGEQGVNINRPTKSIGFTNINTEPPKIIIYPALTKEEQEELKKNTLLKIAQAINEGRIRYEIVKKGVEDFARIELTPELELLVVQSFKKVELKGGKSYFWVPLKTLEEYFERSKHEEDDEEEMCESECL
jgi:hypothetical protein